MPTIKFDRNFCKSAAKRVKSRLADLGHSIPMGAAYEVVAAIANAPEWNVLAARLDVASSDDTVGQNAKIFSQEKWFEGALVTQEVLDEALSNAIGGDDSWGVAIALAGGANPNSGRLHDAAAHPNEVIVRMMLDAGADVRELDENGLTAFDVASQYARLPDHCSSIAASYDGIVEMLLLHAAGLSRVPSPIHCHDGRWWFWDKAWKCRVGPYADEDRARNGLHEYCKTLDVNYARPASEYAVVH